MQATPSARESDFCSRRSSVKRDNDNVTVDLKLEATSESGIGEANLPAAPAHPIYITDFPPWPEPLKLPELVQPGEPENACEDRRRHSALTVSALGQAQPDVLKSHVRNPRFCIPFLFRAFKGTAPTGRDSIAQGASPGKMSKRSQKPQRGEIRGGEVVRQRGNLAPLGLPTHLLNAPTQG
jgi:hypothetical protein